MKIKILYEDQDILAIDKPAGISVHPASGETSSDSKKRELTISDWMLKNYPKAKGVGEPMGDTERHGIVHRLDKDTSGVLLLAKNQKAYAFLKEQFQNHTIRKVYNCIVNGWVKNERGVVNKPIGRSPSDPRKRLSGRGVKGPLREAITEYKVLKRFEVVAPPVKISSRFTRQNPTGSDATQKFSPGAPIKFTLLEVRPKTGRTHQIRVHMKYLNHPIVGDNLYNPNGPVPEGLNGMALHAKSIEFETPSGERIKVETALTDK